MINTLFRGLLLSSILVGSAMAQTEQPVQGTPAIDQRLDNQQQRTDQGLASGQLTQKEATHVQNRDDRIEAADQRDAAANGGKLTPQERRNLNKRLNKDSNKIYKKKHNDTVQPGATPAAQ